MEVKRMRVFAGPNGSGKTTIFKKLLSEKKIDLGVYVNADEIEADLKSNNGQLPFNKFHLIVEEKEIKAFFRNSSFSPIKRAEPNIWEKLKVLNNVLIVNAVIDSYLAADLAEYIRQALLKKGLSFTFETVMSHVNKVNFLSLAKTNGYRVYLYYIATEDPEINSNRVNVRVAQNGHRVEPQIIKSRYFKSLGLLKAAVKNSNRAYIFDNSGIQAKLIAEITEGSDVALNEAVNIPGWVVEYLLQTSKT